MSAKTEKAESSTCQEIANDLKANMTKDSILQVYTLKDAKAATSEYTVFVPASEKDAHVYLYKNNTLTPLNAVSYNSGELLAVTVPDLSGKIVLFREKVYPKAKIVKDEGVESVSAYYKADYTNDSDETDVTEVAARDSETGEYERNGDGQVNLLVKVKDGYELKSVMASPEGAYKNVKGPDETGRAGCYRITKINADITVTFNTKKNADPSPTPPQNGTPSQTPSGKQDGAATGLQGNDSEDEKVIKVVSKPKAPKSLKIKAGKKKATVTFKKVKGAKGYQIRYSNKKNMKSAKTKRISKTKVTIKSLKRKKTYYFQVRAYKVVSGERFMAHGVPGSEKRLNDIYGFQESGCRKTAT